MGECTNSAEQLRAIEMAPVLTRAASAGERVLGVLSVGGLLAGLAASAAADLPVVPGIVVLLLALALVLGWRWFHLGAPGRRPHTKAEDRIAFLGPVSLAIPAPGLLWNNPAALPGSLVAAAVPAAVLAGYLGSRWRR
ncbi:hypothetical protein [Streptomyces gobitricini]|uniref:Integral membrane protein n=1 Tax=Streptomyces gobitricini TaxID=68211 RepID=A0ABN3LHS7_9ACTN